MWPNMRSRGRLTGLFLLVPWAMFGMAASTAVMVARSPRHTSNPVLSQRGRGLGAFSQRTRGYTFLSFDESGSSPIRIDPCAGPIVLRYNSTGEPYSLDQTLQFVANEVEKALGHRVVVSQKAPETAIVISVDWVPTSAYLSHPHPLALAETEPKIQGSRIVGGSIQLVARAPRGIVSPGIGPGAIGTVLAHEVGHAVGLDHVNDEREIMNPTHVLTKDAVFGPGDTRGLQILGGVCK